MLKVTKSSFGYGKDSEKIEASITYEPLYQQPKTTINEIISCDCVSYISSATTKSNILECVMV